MVRRLPPNMPAPPSVQKVNPADQPILFMGLNSRTISPRVVDEYAETLIAPAISSINGVSQVNVFGTAKFAVHVQMDPNKLASRGIGIDEVESSIESHNVNLPSGTLWGPRQAFTVEANGQVMNAAAYRPLVVTYRNGSPVRLEDLGEVIDGVQNDKVITWLNNTPSIMFQVMKQPGTNTVEVVDKVRALFPQFRAQLPPAINMDTLYDRSDSIRKSVDDVKFSLELAVVLVVIVIFLFLRNVSATLIPSLALPLSVIGTFAAMSLLGYTLDNLSLMALTLAVGFVVDDAIVVLENIVRHMEMGKSRLMAALDGGTRDRLHHSFHDAVAGGGFYSGVLHGRHSGAAVPRIRRGDHGRDLDLGLCLAQSDADAVQPLPKAAEREAQRAVSSVRAIFRRDARSCTNGRCAVVMRHRFVMLMVAAGTCGCHGVAV